MYVSSQRLNEFRIPIKLGLNKLFKVKCVVMAVEANTLLVRSPLRMVGNELLIFSEMLLRTLIN